MDQDRTDIKSAYFSPTFDNDGTFHVDKPVGSMSISPCGRDVVLASRQGLHIIDLDSPWAPPRNLPHLTPWEVADVQWSPFPSRDYWVVSTSNQKAMVWNLAMSTSRASIEHILHAHSRAITDINFSAHHPDVLSTCAVDGFVHCWDLRHPARPAVSFCDWFAGATQVKWNRQDPHIIASSHDKILRIWDDRKGAYPLRSIEAHSTKIYGIDWNRMRKHGVVTCSLDRTIKFWDYSREEDEPERVIDTGFPVWRARHTPFGWGMLAMPQRGDNNVYLYDRRLGENTTDTNTAPVKKFKGHDDQVKEFLWRPRGGISSGIDNRDFQLVTWGSDKTLRLHRLEDSDLQNVGYERGKEVHSRLQITRQNAQYKTFREDPGKSKMSNLKPLAAGNKPFLDSETGMEMFRSTVGTMIPSPSTADGGWMGGVFVNSGLGMRNKANRRKDLDPIAWMKGVKIGKKEVVLDQSASSNASPNFRTDRFHEEFENLGEEITHVGSKFSKVEFSHIDVHNRRVNFSLHGPWGQKQSTTWLECRLDFPREYPNNAAPILQVEKTASIESSISQRLQSDCKKIGEAFKASQRSSLEALIHFLQGEQTLDQVIAWTREDQEASVYDDLGEGDESSSSDEGDLDYPGTQSTDFGLSGSGVLNASSAEIKVPFARTCGATWSTDGRLVCFFMPKEEKSTSLAGSLGLEGPAMLLRKKRKIFEGFGRFHKPSNSVRSKASSIGTQDSEESDSEFASDSSNYSSSGSSVSSRGASSRGHSFGPSHTFRTDIFNLTRTERAIDESLRSVASGSAANRCQEGSKNHVSIHRLENMLPSKRYLAVAYSIAGPSPCSFNSEVARSHGLHDLADLWSLLDMILKEDLPVKTLPLGTQDEAVQVLQPLKRQDSGIEMSLKYASGFPSASVKWGQHALGRGHFISELLRHFALIGDIQMLAMVSCIFSPPLSERRDETTDQAHFPILTRSAGPRSGALSSPNAATPVRGDYFPSIEVAFSVLQPDGTPGVAGAQQRNRFNSSSAASSFDASGSDPAVPLSAGLTPPMSFKSARRSFDRLDPNSQSLAGSPERMRWSQRSASNFTSALASSLPRPFGSLTQSASSSPPNMPGRHKVSPMGSFGTSQTQGSAWTSGHLSRSMSIADDSKSSPRNMTQKGQQRQGSGSEGQQISVMLKNQDQFLNDGYSSVPFLAPEEEWRYIIYRQTYANLLLDWGLVQQRTEILKHNLSSQSQQLNGEGRLHRHKPSFPIGKRTDGAYDGTVNQKRLELKSTSTGCGASSGLRRRSGRNACPKCTRRAHMCDFCCELIRARTMPCLNCGHILHSHCRKELSRLMSMGKWTCTTGCECACVKHVEAKVSWPSLGTAVLPSSAPSTIREVGEPAVSPSQPWEDVAYESLAKNLAPNSTPKKVPRDQQQRSKYSRRA